MQKKEVSKNSKQYIQTILPKSESSVSTNKLVTGAILVLTMAALLLALDIKQEVQSDHKTMEACPDSLKINNQAIQFRGKG